MSSPISLEDRIPYRDECAWKEYLAKLSRVAYLAQRITELHNRLQKIINENKGKTLGYLKKKYPGLFEIVFSGFRPNDPSKPFEGNALSRFYYDIYMFGLSLDTASSIAMELRKGNVGRVLNNARFTIDRLRGGNDNVRSVCSSIWSYSRDIIDRVEGVELCGSKVKDLKIKAFKEVSELWSDKCNDFESSVDKVYCGVEMLENLLNDGIELLPQYNALSWFLVSLRSNIDIYIEEYYPNLWRELNKGILKKLELGIDTETINGLKGIAIVKPGYHTRKLLTIIYYTFKLSQLDEIHRYFELSNMFEDYIKHSWSEISNADVTKFLEDLLRKLQGLLPEVTIEHCYYSDRFDFTGSYDHLTLPEGFRCYRISRWLKHVGIALKAEDVLNAIAPLAMYGLAKIDSSGEIELVLPQKEFADDRP